MTWSLVGRILQKMLGRRDFGVLRRLFPFGVTFELDVYRDKHVGEIREQLKRLGMETTIGDFCDRIVFELSVVEREFLFGIVKGRDLEELFKLSEKLPKTEFWEKFLELWTEEVLV